MRSARSLSILLLAALAAACGGGDAESPGEAPDTTEAAADEAPERGSDAAERAIEALRENAEGVAGYVLVEETKGRVDTTRFEKIEVDGLPVFRPVTTAGGPEGGAQPAVAGLLRRASPAGEGEVEGEPTEILVVEDPVAIADAMGGQMDPRFRPTRMEFHVGPDGLPRRMTMSGEATMPSGGTHPITTEVTLTDWRTVDGFAHPFRRTTRVEGMAAMTRAAVEGAMAEMEERMEGMPEARKEQAREMMRQRMEAASEPGEAVTVTRSLEVVRE